MTKKQSDSISKAIRSVLVSVTINMMLAVIKGITGVLGHSYALIADAMESLMDILKSLVVLGGLRIASLPPDSCHPYGHGKAEPLAAIAVALGLLAGAVGLAIQSVREILSPQFGPEPYTLIVLVGVIVVKFSLFHFVIRVGEDVQSTAVKSDAWDHLSDALTSLAAFIGILIAVIGGEGYESADDWAALFACAIIAYNGFNVLHPAIGEIMDEAPPPEIEKQVREVAAAIDGVVNLDICFVRKMGLDYFVDLHVRVNAGETVRDGHEIAHCVKDAIREANPRIRDVLIHIEPSEVFIPGL